MSTLTPKVTPIAPDDEPPETRVSKTPRFKLRIQPSANRLEENEKAHSMPLPGPVRSRSCALSESEISVLDLGPSVTETPQQTNAETSQREQADNHEHVHVDDLESVAVTSDTMSFSNEHPLHLRSRRHNDIPFALSVSQRTISFADEPDCEVRPLSVPHSPKSPRPMRPTVQRSKSSFGGMDPEFLAIQNEQEVGGSRNED